MCTSNFYVVTVRLPHELLQSRPNSTIGIVIFPAKCFKNLQKFHAMNLVLTSKLGKLVLNFLFMKKKKKGKRKPKYLVYEGIYTIHKAITY